ncbi:MAG: fibronectin type III domain-containing protein [Bacteroidales bacterium]|nr:fibronectin type III domain-containing protein [Bacteroidales bacterium]
MKKRIVCIGALVVGLSVTAWGQDAAKVACGPYLQQVTETSFTVMWETDIDAVGWVEVAPDDRSHWYNRERRRYYDLSGEGLLPVTRLHKVVVDGLEPGT